METGDNILSKDRAQGGRHDRPLYKVALARVLDTKKRCGALTQSCVDLLFTLPCHLGGTYTVVIYGFELAMPDMFGR